ncbi:TonB-dependent receptor [Croceivirga radicis]|uniref:TonB-dependent receptor n=1 Tax=Croceivirga radicis TaxID=1929488 RepID=UPI000255AFAB|nr:TonB-dependent receptor [Croceivirga radicis]
MKNLLMIMAMMVTVLSMAQEQTGSIVGKLTDKELNDEPLAFANVLIKGTTTGTTSDFDGLYEIAGLEPGTYVVEFSYLGYETVEIPNVVVEAGKVTTVNVPMSAGGGFELSEVVVTTVSRKDSEVALLLDQKKSVEIKTTIGAQELAKKAVSDASDATTKVTGVNKQEGSSKIYVRGLGDRYNSTTFNGLPLPSNDPRDKNIDLSLFGTGIIENVGISKAFTSNISSDVAGANINIVSKEMSGDAFLKIGISSGANTRTTFNDFKRLDGSNWLGIADETKHQISNLNEYNFSNSFSPENTTAAPNFGLSLNYGKRFTLSDESSLGVFLVGSFSNKFQYREGFSDNIIDVDNVGSQFDTKTFDYDATKMLMGNVVYNINPNHKLSFNHLFVHSNSQQFQDFFGTTADIDGDLNVNLILQTEIQNQLFVNQLHSTNKFGESVDVNASVAYNAIYNDEPDRRKNTFVLDNNTGNIRVAQNAVRDNSRFYGNLFETDLGANLEGIKYFGDRVENKGKLTAGYNGRLTDRKFDGMYFDHNFTNPRGTSVDLNNLDAIFNQENIDNGTFRLETSRGRNSDDPETYLPQLYDGKKTVHAGFLDLVYKVGEKFTLNPGIRAEDIKMNVTWNTNITLPGLSSDSGIDLDKQYFLPSLNLKYELTDKINLRASGSLSYTYPQFKEIAPFVYEGINFQESGNPNLVPSDNYNAELKFEFFPKSSEVFAIGVFGKLIENSINRLERNSAVERDFTFDNSGDATIYGAEIEAKFDVLNVEDDLKNKNLSVGANATFMKTELEFDTSNTLFNYTGSNSQLEGAAPFTINADVTYKFGKDKKETTSSLVFNYQSDKVYSIGTNFKENIIEKGVPVLDFVLRHQFNETFTLNFNAKNLFDPSFERYRDIPEELTMSSYKRGMNISAGLSINL